MQRLVTFRKCARTQYKVYNEEKTKSTQLKKEFRLKAICVCSVTFQIKRGYLRGYLKRIQLLKDARPKDCEQFETELDQAEGQLEDAETSALQAGATEDENDASTWEWEGEISVGEFGEIPGQA